MNIQELSSFKMSDAIKFHDQLNPKLFTGTSLIPEVKSQLELIAQDFLEELGIHDINVDDITISGSNAAYSYTPNSDLDLHILVDMSKLPNDAIYKELFNAKKTIYNDSHDITIRQIPVELYVQDSSVPVISVGEYSLMNDSWIRIPSKRRANFDQTATKAKFNKLLKLAKIALRSDDLTRVDNVIQKIRQYRQAGLDKGGEFSSENLSFKVLRSQGYIDKLYDLRNKLHDDELSIEESSILNKTTPTVTDLVVKHKVPKEYILSQLDAGIKIEKEHTNDYDTAKEIALDHLNEDPDYYKKLAKAELEENASGYIPSNAEKNDPRFKTALTVDIKPDSLKKNAKAFGFNISRAGIPPLLR